MVGLASADLPFLLPHMFSFRKDGGTVENDHASFERSMRE